MKTNKRILAVVLTLIMCATSVVTLAACNLTIVAPSLTVTFDHSHKVHESDTLDSLKSHLTVVYTNPFGIESELHDYTISGELTVGESEISVRYSNLVKTVTITVLADDGQGNGDGNGSDDDNKNGDTDDDNKNDGDDVPSTYDFEISFNKTFIVVNDNASLTVSLAGFVHNDAEFVFVSGEECVTRYGVSLVADSKGIVKVYVKFDSKVSNVATLQIVDPADDPYENTNFNTFHSSNYNEAADLEDAYWRTQHNLMSGDISAQDQAPTVADNQPKSGDKFIRNSDDNYLDNGNTYAVVDENGEVVNKIYKFGAYVTLEEVAAYVYAFGDVPANYISSNSASKLSGSPWKQFLRLNHNYFSGDTSSYPYEPLLPRISGEGGDLDYYEIDIGTTGTDCDPRYDSVIYNDGNKITRGAARIVYTRYYEVGGHIDDLKDRYVFYTYNHYNDFQEYLNYQGGWGVIFGNVTGGGTISSKTDYKPTPYVEVVRQSFAQLLQSAPKN